MKAKLYTIESYDIPILNTVWEAKQGRACLVLEWEPYEVLYTCQESGKSGIITGTARKRGS